MSFDDRVDDIALFFSTDKGVQKCWISHEVYTDPKHYLGPVQGAWQGAVVMVEQPGVYVANLANLKSPGEGLAGFTREPSKKIPENDQLKPEAGDLVVVPFSDPSKAFLVPKARYLDSKVCPPILDLNGADLSFMAITEGVVLANLPKIDLAGMTCYLLNLLAMRPNPVYSRNQR